MRSVHLLRVAVPAPNCQDLASSDSIAAEPYPWVLRVVGNADPVEGWQGEDIDRVVLDGV